MNFLRLLSNIVLGLFACAGLLYLVAIAVNWKDAPPSAAAKRFEEMIAARPQVAPSDNAVVYLIAFSAPAGQDPREVGKRRYAWLESFSSQASSNSDPMPDSADLDSAGSKQAKQIGKECQYERQDCAPAFDQAIAEWQPTEMESLALQRYQALLGHRAWRDVIPMHMAAPLPAYGDVLHAQRLYLLQTARERDLDALRAALNTDLVFWRNALAGSETLIAKMISIAALRNHFYFSNLVLRRLPPEQVMRAVPPEWQREFSAEERSMYLVMAGEYLYSRSALRFARDEAALTDMVAGAYEPTAIGKVLDVFAKPLFQEQDTLNGVAERYLGLAQQFSVPMNQYAAAKRTLDNEDRDHPHPISIYNPIGDIYLRAIQGPNYANYAFRSANAEGMRRAALLVTQLRARGVAVGAVPDELARAELREPYANAPFEWDPKRASVVFTSPEDHMWRRNEFFY